MRAAHWPVQRHANAKLLVVDGSGRVTHRPARDLAWVLRSGDLVVANDAATLPASLAGVHASTGRAIEVRLAGRESLEAVADFAAIVFGEGDFRTPTEERPPPPALHAGDTLTLGPLAATITRVLGHPRFVRLHFEGSADAIREGLARHGRPIQYAHLAMPLALWASWTPIAAAPVAFEAPSASFVLGWQMLADIAARGIGFVTITHAAGISSTGDARLDALLPFDEVYRISPSAAGAIERARASGGRIIAVGTTVVRALEHAALHGSGRVSAGAGVATQRIGPDTRLRVVDVLLSGTHERGSSHYEMLRAFTRDATLERIAGELEMHDYRSHEFGDSVLLERAHESRPTADAEPSCDPARERSSAQRRLSPAGCRPDLPRLSAGPQTSGAGSSPGCVHASRCP